MSGYRRVNYYELCRLCTSNKGTKVHMFREEAKKRQIVNKIQFCLSLEVDEKDSLPKLICNLCLEKLESFYDFRSNCHNAVKMLESPRKMSHWSLDCGHFEMDGMVYIKENKLESLDESNTDSKNVATITSATGDSIPFKEKEMKVSSHSNEIVALPLNFNNFEHLAQGATIHLLPEKELFKFQNNVKNTVQVQHNLESIAADQTYSFNVQSENLEEESVRMETEDNLNSFVADTCTQLEKEEILSQSDEIIGSAIPEKNSISQISEFLKLKTMCNSKEKAVESLCENCGTVFNSDIEKSSHSETCNRNQLKISEQVVMIDVDEDKAFSNYGGPFSCDDCVKVFKRKEHLVQHKKLHTGERPFQCSQCSSTFARKEHLLRHVVCHTGEKPYSCDICGKLFGRKDNVGKHMRTHQVKSLFLTNPRAKVNTNRSKEIHKCGLCGAYFSRPESLKKHLGTKHNISDKCNIIVSEDEQPVSILEKALRQISG